MDQKDIKKMVIVVPAAIIVALIVFALVRSGHDHEGGHETKKEAHRETTQQHYDGDAQQDEITPSGRLVDGVRVIKMVVRKFEFDPNLIVVNEVEKVKLELTSEDVTHGIGIEEYNIDRKLDPGKTEIITFQANKPGRHHFHCSIYCGSGHGGMHGELVVLEQNR